LGSVQELLGLPLQASLLQDALKYVLPSLKEPLVVEHEVPAGVVGVTRVRYVGAGVTAEAQRYPGVVQGLEELLDVLQVHAWALIRASYNMDAGI